jgi:hypothetical protein
MYYAGTVEKYSSRSVRNVYAKTFISPGRDTDSFHRELVKALRVSCM